MQKEVKEIQIGKTIIPYVVKYSKRKTIGLSVEEYLVTIRAPVGTSDEFILETIKKKKKWILEKFNYFKKFKIPLRQDMISGERILLKGRLIRLTIVKNAPKNDVVFETTKITVYVNKKYESDEYDQVIKEQLVKWYKATAKVELAKLVKFVIKNYYFPEEYNQVPLKVRTLKRKWGTYSRDGDDFTLTLNWKLIMAPLESINYVICHEFIHAKYMNHDAEFWNHFTAVDPHWKRKKEDLAKNGKNYDFPRP